MRLVCILASALLILLVEAAPTTFAPMKFSDKSMEITGEITADEKPGEISPTETPEKGGGLEGSATEKPEEENNGVTEPVEPDRTSKLPQPTVTTKKPRGRVTKPRKTITRRPPRGKKPKNNKNKNKRKNNKRNSRNNRQNNKGKGNPTKDKIVLKIPGINA